MCIWRLWTNSSYTLCSFEEDGGDWAGVCVCELIRMVQDDKLQLWLSEM